MSKPLPSKCAKYCKDNAQCTRTECNRELGWYAGTKQLVMFNDEESVKWQEIVKKRNDSEPIPLKFHY